MMAIELIKQLILKSKVGSGGVHQSSGPETWANSKLDLGFKLRLGIPGLGPGLKPKKARFSHIQIWGFRSNLCFF